jgi:hypothetical protein
VGPRLPELSLVLPDDVWLTDLSAKAPVSPALAGARRPPPRTSPPAVSSSTATRIRRPPSHGCSAASRVIPDLYNVQLVKSKLEVHGNTSVVNFTIAADLRQLAAGS